MEIVISKNTRSSRTLALVSPDRFGLEVVQVFYGTVRRCYRQGVAVRAGQLVRCKGLGSLSIPQRFDYVENGVAHFTAMMDLAGK